MSESHSARLQHLSGALKVKELRSSNLNFFFSFAHRPQRVWASPAGRWVMVYPIIVLPLRTTATNLRSMTSEIQQTNHSCLSNSAYTL